MSWQPTAAADGCVGKILKLIHMRECVMQALARLSSADVSLANRHCGMWWQHFIFEITSGVGSFQPVPVPPAGAGAQREVVIGSDSSAGSDANSELWPLSWDSRFKEGPDKRAGRSSVSGPARSNWLKQ